MVKKVIVGSIAFIFLLSYFNYIGPTPGECRKIDLKKVKRLKWIDPLGREPTSFKQFQAMRLPSAPLKVKTIRRVSAKSIRITKTTDSLVAIIVNSDLYPRIQTSLDQYVNDLVQDGYSVEVDLWSGGDYRDLRDSLKYKWAQSGLVGAVLIGDLPVAWCELFVWGAEEFPIDYYFMELDGVWSDSDNDGLLEGLSAGSGDLGPEIWVGRLAPSSLIWGSRAQLLENYFTKNHNYRIGNLSLPHRALSFVDDDWYYFYDCDLSYAYDDVTVVNDVNQTIAFNYKQGLLGNYEWVHLCAHSSCWAHTFLINGSQWGGGSVYNYEIHALQPHALFYNLFACSNTRFMETNNLGNWYIFLDDYGLAAIGSAKTGSMLDFYSFYYPLGQGKSIGDAYKEWFEVQAQDGFDDWEKGWFFGNNILGDPTLTIHVQSQVAQTIDSARIQPRWGNSAWIPIQVTTSGFSDGNPAMTADFSDNIWATYETGRDVRSNIYSSSYDGTSWSPAEAVDVYTYWDFHPAMATDSLGKVWVAWQGYRELGGNENFNICVSSRTPSGWTSPTIITSGADYDVEPAMTVGKQGKIWVVWKGWRSVNQSVNSNIFAKYYDGSWSSRMTVTSDLHDDCDPVVVADTSGKIWVAWSTNRNGNWDIYSVYYDNGDWSALIPITTDPDDDLASTITRDGSGNIWIAWHSWRDGNANIYTRYNDGAGWSAPVQISSDPNNDIMPNLAASPSGEVALTWMSNRYGNWDIFVSFYDGSSWFSPQPVTTDLNDDYESACLFDQSENPCVIWASDRDGNWNIYFASYRFSAPDLIYPENFSYINDNTPGFEWSAVYKSDEGEASWSFSSSTITYTLQYSKDDSFLSDVIVISDIPDNFYELPESLALSDTTYFWRVQAVKESGDSSGYQSAFIFTVDTQPPETPVLISPADDTLICGATPTFEWSSLTFLLKPATLKNEIILSAPVRFTLQYSPDSEFTTQVTTVDSLVDNFYTVPDSQALNPDTSYYWRVRAFDLAGNQSDFQSNPFVFSMFILGDANDDGNIDVSDVVYLINYLFVGGPEPSPFQAGDANSDEVVDIADVVYLINYLFLDGPPPDCE
ncbi:MAG: dockerin type I domain-containing protein [Candidatus Zixiibacteriota bacterium]